MNTLQLEKQWEKIGGAEEKSLSYLRIDGTCIPDLHIAVKGNNHRCLMLKLPKDYVTSFRGEDKENIRTSYSKKGNYILLELLDSYYNTLFNDLIISLYFKIKDISASNESTNTFISTINKWASFLEKSKNSKLPKEVVRGLYGELVILKEYLSETDTDKVNDILKSWTGPYDTSTDFMFDNLNVEVKTKSSNSSTVKISSEFQLDHEQGKELNLSVVSVDSDNKSTDTLDKEFNKIRDQILELNGDLSIITEALSQKNLFPSALKEYDDFKFTPVSVEVYDCDIEIHGKSFPRLKNSELSEELKKIRYEINLSGLDDFKTYQKDF